MPIVQALTSDELQEKAQLEQLIREQEEAKELLGVEASSIDEAVQKLSVQIASLQTQLEDSYNQIDIIKAQVDKAEKELDKQKKILGRNIKAMYLEGQISTLEMLASSKNLSDFVDKEQQRTTVQSKIRSTLDKITQLKHQLNAQKDEIERYAKEQEAAKTKIAKQKDDQNRLLSLNAEQQQALTEKIKGNSTRVAELNRKQVEENMRALGGSIPSGVPGGGGYKYGDAVCIWPNVPNPPCGEYDWGYPNSSSPRNIFDEWGYGYRNCTSWAAFRVAQVKGYTPASLTGLGHAKNWPSNTSATVNYDPNGGVVVAIRDGTYGHVMFVESVLGGDMIEVSDYNLGGDGIYRRYAVSTSGLQFIHF
ncbi:CHAP domain-containing protein [Candidatus Saccharibacteria bacterium]|nr:CHAP domain-containing protein [Candidatus Saccharibacteria bacterium]